MRRFFFATIFISAFLLLAPESSSATSCCKSDGTELFTYPDQEQCVASCSRDSRLTGISITCMPSCAILNAEDCSTLGGQCIEAENGVCPTGQPPIAGRCERYDTQACCSPAPPTPEFDIKVPKLQIPLFTMKPFTIPFRVETPEGGSAIVINFIANYIEGLYRFMVGIAGILAAIMIIWAGITWLTAAGNPEKIGGAKKRLASAAMGLILVLGSYVILYVINPDLVFLKPLRIKTAQRVLLNLEEQEEEQTTRSGSPIISGTACNAIDTCRELCNTPTEQWPLSTTTTPDLNQLQTVASSDGVDVSSCPDGCKGTTTLVQKIKQAGLIAKNRTDGQYTLAITSAFRPLSKQIQLVCNKITCSQNESKCVDKGTYDPNKFGRAIAWPGGSNHGQGIAMDIALVKDGEIISCSGCYNEQTNARWQVGAETLAHIMFEAGFVRYCKEIWHFELPSGTDCRSNTCGTNTISCP